MKVYLFVLLIMVKLHVFTKKSFSIHAFEKKIKIFIVTLYACIPYVLETRNPV